jgi:hypothetical protein
MRSSCAALNALKQFHQAQRRYHDPESPEYPASDFGILRDRLRHVAIKNCSGRHEILKKWSAGRRTHIQKRKIILCVENS